MTAKIPFGIPANFEAYGRLQFFRKSDGENIGHIELNTKGASLKFTANRTMPGGPGSTHYALSTYDTLEDAIASLETHAETIADKTKDDPDIVRVCNGLHRIQSRVIGGGFTAIALNDRDKLPAAYRDDFCIGRLYRGGTKWRVVSHRGDMPIKRFASYGNALDYLGDLAMPESPSGHEWLEREAQKKEDRKKRRERGEPDPDLNG